MNYHTIEIERSYHISTIWLNRPDVRNAFDDIMIGELLTAFREEEAREDVRAIILRGKGKVFCAGADLNWMRRSAGLSYEENYRESLRLAECFRQIYSCGKPTLAIVHGAAMGGAIGLMAACDFAFCNTDTLFTLSEIKLGIAPATISPYVIKRMGEYNARELMLTGRPINGIEAEQYQLVNKCFAEIHDTEAHLQATLQLLMTSGPRAITACKKLIDTVVNQLNPSETPAYTARLIAELRASEEGQEGMAAFLEKRKPAWIK